MQATHNLSLECLEPRELPSASVAIVGSRMVVTGDDAANAIVVRDDGRGHVTATVTTGSSIVSATGSGINRIVIDARGGDDTVDFRLTRNLLVAEELDVDLGAGNDRAYIDLYRGLSGVPFDLELAGGAGKDSAEVRFGEIVNSDVHAHMTLGADADNLNFIMFKGLSGNSHMDADVAGNSGADRVDMNVTGKIDGSASLSLHADNVADADDRLVLRYKGELDGKFNVDIDRSAAQYGVQGRFALDPASSGMLTATVSDGHGTFLSTLVVTDHTGGPKVSVLDRLESFLTHPDGTAMSGGI